MISAGFAPVTSPNARVLLLGSLPGRVSLERQQYYAQPRNSFWTLMGRLFGFEPDLCYPLRLAALKHHRVALWDVCAAATRPGSLDAAIVTASVKLNDFPGFFEAHERIEFVFFNGATAASLYNRRVVPNLHLGARPITYQVLPSTSPAHAAMTVSAKLERWACVRRASDG